MKTKLSVAIYEYQKAGEVLRNAADVALAESAYDLTYEQSKALMESIYEGEINGARAEGRIMEIRAATIVKERQMKLIAFTKSPTLKDVLK